MRFYENPQETSENRMLPRSWYIPENPGAYTLLNGTWRFRYYTRDIDLEEKIDCWDTIDVPSCWQARGYENPNYTNVNFPFPADPPYVPDDNPCGVYEREFEITNAENKTYFVFEGVASTGVLYINGSYVGFTTGNHLQAEFDITPYVVKGVNTVRVVADTPFECNVSQYSQKELFQTGHAAHLKKDGVTHVRIDYKNSGIGSGSCGPQLMDPYRLNEKIIHFCFQIRK